MRQNSKLEAVTEQVMETYKFICVPLWACSMFIIPGEGTDAPVLLFITLNFMYFCSYIYLSQVLFDCSNGFHLTPNTIMARWWRCLNSPCKTRVSKALFSVAKLLLALDNEIMQSSSSGWNSWRWHARAGDCQKPLHDLAPTKWLSIYWGS